MVGLSARRRGLGDAEPRDARARGRRGGRRHRRDLPARLRGRPALGGARCSRSPCSCPYVVVVALAEGHDALAAAAAASSGARWASTTAERHPHGRELWEPLLVIPPAVAAIVLGSIGMVHSSLRLADRVGLPHVLVGVLLLAVLTSLPNAYTGVRLGRARRGVGARERDDELEHDQPRRRHRHPRALRRLRAASRACSRSTSPGCSSATAVAVALLWRPGGMRRGGGALLLLSWVGFAVVQGIFG